MCQLTRLSEEEVSNCDIFKNLKLKLEDIVSRYNHIEALNTQLREEATKLQAERTSFKETVENESQAQMIELQSQLTRAEHDVARIRNLRDEAQQELHSRRAIDEGAASSYKEVKELSAMQEARIQSLELEITHLKARLETDSKETNQALAGMSLEELIAKCENLQKANNALSAELSPLEAAFKRTLAQTREKVANSTAKDDLIEKLKTEVCQIRSMMKIDTNDYLEK